MKQGQAFGLKKIIGALIPLLVLFLLLAFYYRTGGSFGKIKDLVKDIAPKIGAQEIKGEKPVLSQEHQEAITGLKRAIEFLAKPSNKDCLVNYQQKVGKGKSGLPDLGEKGSSIIFEKDGNNLAMIILGGTSGKQEISRETIPSASPCVINGLDNSGNSIPQSFFDKFFSSIETKTNYYRLVDGVEIKYGSVWYAINKNRIRPFDRTSGIQFEDNGYLFTPGNGVVCFFPTRGIFGGCDARDNEGLDSACLEDNFIKNSKLKTCG